MLEEIVRGKVLVKPEYPIDVLGNPNKQWKKAFTAQGDCLIKKIGKHGVFKTEYESIPSDAKPIEGNLVLKGALNSHALYFGEFQLFEKGDIIFLRVITPTILDHVKDHKFQVRAEHHAQWIPPGEYFRDVVLEYDHLREEARRVID